MNILYWLLCILIGLLPALFIYRKDRLRQIPVKWLPAVLRFLCFFFTAALLLAPVFTTTRTVESPPVIVWLQDQSRSVGAALKKDSSAYRKEVQALWTKWRKNHQVLPAAFASRLTTDSIFVYRQEATDITQALQEVKEQYQDRNIGAIVLATDGNFNQGLNPLFAGVGDDIPIYTVGIGDSTIPADIRISRTYANKTVSLHHTFEIIADIQADKLSGVATEAMLRHDGKTIAHFPVSIPSNHYTGTIRFTVKAAQKGLQRYRIVLKGVQGEKNLKNNERDVYVDVIEKKIKILILAAAPHPDIAAIKAALKEDDQYEITIHYGAYAPEKLTGYQLIIAHQWPRNQQTSWPPVTPHTPIWYILGGQSNPTSLSAQLPLLKVSGFSGHIEDVVYSEMAAAFSYFTLPENIADVLTKMPPLQVPAARFQVSPAAQMLLSGKSVTSGEKVPLWLFQQQGSPIGILTGTGLWRWRVFEYKNYKSHEVIDALIRQTVRFLTAAQNEQGFRVFTMKPVFNDNEPITAYGALRNPSGELINTPHATLVLKDSTGKAVPYEFERDGRRYRINLGLLAPGRYLYEGKVSVDKSDYTGKGAFQVTHESLELLKNHADYALLYQLAHQSGGRFFMAHHLLQLEESIRQDKHLKPVLQEEKVNLHLIDKKWFFLIILCCAIFEWLLRKYWSI